MNPEVPGELVQYCTLPAAAGMDALEAYLVVVQELPLKTELQFYAARDGKRVRLTTEAARAVLRDHVPKKPVGELTEIELRVEISVLRAEATRLWPVYEAAKAWRADHNESHNCCASVANLYAAVDAAAAAEGEPRRGVPRRA